MANEKTIIEAATKTNSLVNIQDLTIPVLDDFVVQQNVKMDSKFIFVATKNGAVEQFLTDGQLIDDEDLRTIWAHLLVEETKKANSISPRTLDVVKNLSRQEAEAFVRIIPGTIDNAVIVNDTGHPLWGTYSEMLALQDARLVGSQSSSVTHSANAENQQHNKIVVIPFLDSKLALIFEKDKITINVNVLTTAGREIYGISKKPLSLNQIIKIAEAISRQNQKAITSILPTKIISTESNGEVKYQYFWTPIWTNRSTTSTTQENTK